MDFQYLLDLIVAFFLSWQVKTLVGLILIDVVLGIAAALRTGVFDWKLIGQFYSSNVLPYVLGFLAFYVAVGYIIPPESLGDLGELVNETTVTLAWGVLVATLVGSILKNFNLLYKGPEA